MTTQNKLDNSLKLLKRVEEEFSPAALASSFSLEDMILTDLICKNYPSIEIITLDTGRLHQETYNLMQTVAKKYGTVVKVYFPEFNQLQDFVTAYGPNSFYESINMRKECCRIRKLEPLDRALSGKRAWITGLRTEQSVTRENLPPMQYDETRKMQKFNPLHNWTLADVWSFIDKNDIPTNVLYKQGFPSIGCSPCTRAVKEGENIRSGRWWWENPDTKECGLHSANK